MTPKFRGHKRISGSSDNSRLARYQEFRLDLERDHRDRRHSRWRRGHDHSRCRVREGLTKGRSQRALPFASIRTLDDRWETTEILRFQSGPQRPANNLRYGCEDGIEPAASLFSATFAVF